MEYTRDELRIGDLLAPEFMELLAQKRAPEARDALLDLLDPQIADVLIALPAQPMAVIFRLLPRNRAANVFTLLPEDQQQMLVEEMSHEQLAKMFDEMPPDDRAQLFGELPGQITAKVLALMNPAERRKTQIILGYPPESIGRIMTPDYLTVRPEWTVQQVLEHIRRHGKDAETFNTLYVVDELGILVDEVRLRQLLLADSSTPVEALIDRHVISLPAHADREEAVRVMSRYDFPVLPVVDSGGILVGIVTFDDIADVAQRETTEDIQKLGAVQVLEEPYMSATLWELVRKRGGWLSVLFLGEMLTASAMTFFQAEIEKAAVVALFVPLIISSGGNSGSQASTLIIRAMALGEIRLKDWVRVLRREAACGLILGMALGVIGLLRIHIWQLLHLANYDSNRAFVKDAEHKVYNLPGLYHMIGLTVGIALIGVVLWGTLMGAMLPFLLKKLRLDPATISAPLVATLVDVTGLIIYFTTAMILLRHTLL